MLSALRPNTHNNSLQTRETTIRKKITAESSSSVYGNNGN